MATYFELLQAAEHQDLTRRVRVAVIVAAEAVRAESGGTANHPNRLVWAKGVFERPDQEAQRMLWVVLAQNKDATLAQIIGASDSVVQSAVNAAVDVFATG